MTIKAWRKRTISALAVAGMAAACATFEGYEQRLNLMLGAHADDLVVRWGVPDRSIELSDGREVFEYDRHRIEHSEGYCYDDTRTVEERVKRSDGSSETVEREIIVERCDPPSTDEYFCMTRFVLGQDKRVVDWAHEGNDCVAVPLDQT